MLYLYIILVIAIIALSLRNLMGDRTYRTDVDLVIARYNEDLTWFQKRLSEIKGKYRKITIYDKGTLPIDRSLVENLPAQNVRIVRLPNVGRDAGPYLKHILDTYDSPDLASVTVFLPGSCDVGTRLRRCHDLLQTALYKSSSFRPMFGNLLNYLPYFKNFKIDAYQATHPLNKSKSTELLTCPERPFGKWFAKVFGPEARVPSLMMQAVVVATREQIRSRPKAFYEQLQTYVNAGDNTEAGHYLERAWGTVFNP